MSEGDVVKGAEDVVATAATDVTTAAQDVAKTVAPAEQQFVRVAMPIANEAGAMIPKYHNELSTWANVLYKDVIAEVDVLIEEAKKLFEKYKDVQPVKA